MQLIILSCLLAIAACAPQEPIPIAILRQESTGEGTNFNHIYESEDGTVVESSGTVGSAGQANLAGRFVFVGEDGSPIEISYIADENGFQPTGNHLPQPVQAIHPVPAHVLELLQIAEEQRAQGVQFDHQGFRLN